MTLILSGTNGLSDVDGTAATPAIRGTDANTGIFFPAADQLAASVNGVEGLRLTSTGLGIGTSTPGVRLDVNGALRVGLASNPTTIASNSQFYDQSGIGPTISGYNFEVRTGNPTPSARMIVDSVGNVGIGTSSPTAPLHIKQSFGSKLDVLVVENDVDPGINFLDTGNWSSRIFVQGSTGSLVFENQTDTERMRIDSSGNLLIGTTTAKELITNNGRMFLANQTAPSTPTGGGVLYVEDGALKYKGSSGTVTTIAAA